LVAAGGTGVLLQRTHDGREDVASVLGNWAREHDTTSIKSCRLDLAMGIFYFLSKRKLCTRLLSEDNSHAVTDQRQ
jgi:hypothetical protein